MTFEELGLIPEICSALKEQGYQKPTPIQEGAIPPALRGRDVLGCAQTGTGKTCAFATPILQTLSKRSSPKGRIRALVLTPTRELAIQIGDCFRAYGRHLYLRSTVIFGGVGQQPQVDKIRSGLDILTATPGRLLDLHGQGLIDLSGIEILVLDEADRMLDMGFIHDVRRILKLLPEKKQTLFFSATMPPEVMELVNELLHNYVRVEADPVSSPVEAISQTVYFVDKGNKTNLLAWLIREKKMDSVLVFSRTKHGANRIVEKLEKEGISARAIHGNKSQTARQEALAEFKAGRVTALIATDIAARGLDIDALDWVINYDLPEVPETYVHRIGRTGRAGREGAALSFCCADEQNYLKGIEKLLGHKIPVEENHPFPMVEPPTGVDPMVQAKREGRENMRQQRAAQHHTEQNGPASLPKEAEKEESAFTDVPEFTEENDPLSGVGSYSSRTPKRGVRLNRPEDTVPENPSQPRNDFVKPDPLASDSVMDATARLLAPGPRIYSQRQGKQNWPGEKSNQSDQKKKQSGKKQKNAGKNNSQNERKQDQKSGKQEPKAEKQEEKGGKQINKNRKRHKKNNNRPQKNASSSENAANQTGTEKREDSVPSSHWVVEMNEERHGRKSQKHPPRPMRLPNHEKDSTEQPSLMKPFYLSDDGDDDEPK